jgi:regulatory protein
MNRIITALKAQKKNPNRVNVYLDGNFAFGVARIVAAWLNVGQELSPEKVASLQQQDAQEVAYQKAVHFLSFRSRSESEISKKLTGQGFSNQEIDPVLTRLRESGLVGDTQFARTWIENRTAFRPRSRRLLYLELRQKGVAEDVISEALEEARDDTDLANEAARRYTRRLSGLGWGEFRERMQAFLMRRGFSYGTIKSVIKRQWSEISPASGENTNYVNEDLG